MLIIAIGTEVIECVRIGKMIERHGELFLERVYTFAEVAYCSERSTATQHFSAMWAAKEAVMKTLGGRRNNLRWNQVEIFIDGAGATSVRLAGAARQRGEMLNISAFQISLGRCRTHATAFVIATGS